MNKLISALAFFIIGIGILLFVGTPADATLSPSLIKIDLTSTSTELASGVTYTPPSVPVRLVQISLSEATGSTVEGGSVYMDLDAAEGADYDVRLDTFAFGTDDNKFENYGETSPILNGGASLFSVKDGIKLTGDTLEGSVHIILT